MHKNKFLDFFNTPKGNSHLINAVNLALEEDGKDLTSEAIFSPEHRSRAYILAKEDTFVAALPIIPIVLKAAEKYSQSQNNWSYELLTEEGSQVKSGTIVSNIIGSTALILKAERVILNFISNISGVANLTARYVEALKGSTTKLLDTRKTSPALRYPQKYGVLIGGGYNHRLNLEEMLMLKDNHIDAAGSITRAVNLLLKQYQPCPPIEVECRNIEEVKEALSCKIQRIMLDNMAITEIKTALELIPDHIETEVSGGLCLYNMQELAFLKPKSPDFISVGRITHSAVTADFSLRFYSGEKNAD